MLLYKAGDHVKVEFRRDGSQETEWMWIQVDHCDDEQGLIFGRLDSEPVVNTGLRVGQELAVSYDKVREHRRF